MWSEEEEEGCWPDKLGHIEGNMLVPWVKTMGREIAGLQIVEKIVERRNGLVGEEIGPADRVIGIK